MSQLGCRLMVGQEILVLFIMVRIRAPQPEIKSPLWRFYFWSEPLFVIRNACCRFDNEQI